MAGRSGQGINLAMINSNAGVFLGTTLVAAKGFLAICSECNDDFDCGIQ